MTPYLRQADKRWADLEFYPGGAKVGRAGCTLTCVCIAARHLKTWGSITPAEALPIAQAMDALVSPEGTVPGNLLLTGKLCSELGMTASEHLLMSVVGERMIRDVILDALRNGVCILWVDHDSTRPGGDLDGEHYVVALQVDGEHIICADPATGTECRISTSYLSGPAPWGNRTYRVRGARAVRLTRNT